MNSGIITLLIILNTCIFSYRGFKQPGWTDKYAFNVERILVHRQYWRLLSSGLVHVNWMHLLFNMFMLYLVGLSVEAQVGSVTFLLLYLVGLAGSDLLALLIHRKNPDYSTVGASGAVNAVLFASLTLSPGMGIGLFFLPISIPGWLFALLFVGYSIYGIRSRRQNVGHEAHLGGALIGVLAAIALNPGLIYSNYLVILVTVVPVVAFMYLIITRPHLLLVDNFFFKTHQKFNIDQAYNLKRRKREMQLDDLLEKIQKKGMKHLTAEELKKLKEYSEQL